MIFGNWDDVLRMTLIGAPTYCGTVIAAMAFADDGGVSGCSLRMPGEPEASNGLAAGTTILPSSRIAGPVSILRKRRDKR